MAATIIYKPYILHYIQYSVTNHPHTVINVLFLNTFTEKIYIQNKILMYFKQSS